MLRPGMFLQDRYEILEAIGSGGMSVVYKAKCHKLNRLVAIKVLKEEFSRDSIFVSKFKLEAQAAAGLSQPNIVNVYDVIDEGDLHYIVMELIEGITLKHYIAKKGRLPFKETIGIALQVAQGMEAAHSQGIVHRDIKPQNIIISKDGKIKVADFGIARAISSQTLNSTAMGSVHYISPEQARGGYSDARSDIYSLGITMYEMVTGRVPFEGENTVTVALAHIETPVPAPGLYAPELPVSLEKIILKCTEKKPERRYNTAVEVIADLRKALVEPDEDFVKFSPVMDSSHTVVIGQPEMAQIREGKRTQPESAGGYPGGYAYKEPGSERRLKERPAGGRGSGRSSGDDINPHIEKLLTAVGIIAAIIVVAALLVIFSKVSGLFGAGEPSDPGSSEISTQETTLSEKQVAAPDVLGLSEEMASKKLSGSDLQIKFNDPEFSDKPEGEVIRQEPLAGTAVDRFSNVYVTLSKGPEHPELDLTAMGLLEVDGEAARLMLEDKELTVKVEGQASDTVPTGRVVSFSPEKAKAGDTVTLYVSSGPALKNPAVMPNITGQPEEIAVGMLEDAGLAPGEVIQQASEDVPKGTVTGQAIAAGSSLEAGTAVNYTVSSGPAQPDYKYLASIDKSYPLQNMVGPGASTTQFRLKVRLKQEVNGETKYRDLIEPQTMTGDQILPIAIQNIEGAYGVTAGEVEVVNADTDEVLKSYPITFVAVPQS